MRSRLLFYLALCVFCCNGLLFAEEPAIASPKLKAEVDKLKQWGTDPTILAAVKAQNAKNVSLDQIKSIDKDWMDAKDTTDFMKSLMTSPCAKKLEELSTDLAAKEEIFVMDNQGALVCLTKRTSDYWQGDEEKWTNSYRDGKGEVFLGKQEYDMSSKTTLIHVSVPVQDGEKTVGVICAGISLSKLAQTN